MREWIEYFAAWSGLKILGILPRRAARVIGASVARIVYAFWPALDRICMVNLRIALPDWSDERRRDVIRGMLRQVGWMAGEFSQFPKYIRKNIERIVVVDGLDNFDSARKRGKGILFLTGHMSAWELAPFAQALYGYPLHFLVRPISNQRVDALVNSYRCRSGNRPIDKNRSARAILQVLAQGGTVGILSDHNTSVENVFVPFFGALAATASGLARIALRTDAAVVPGFLSWDKDLRKYRLRFDPAVELVRTGDDEADIIANTARFNDVIEDYIRAHPEQWFWVHKRWKTRPPGEKSLYPS